LAIRLRGEDRVVLTSLGEGSTAQGEWYEAVNWAAIHKLPVIFMVENNSYAISVPADRQMAVPSVADKACGLGLNGVSVDGLDVFAIYDSVSEAAALARSGGGPSLIEARVQRMTPHSSDDDDRSYRTREEVELMKANDPLVLFRDQLSERGILTSSYDEGLQDQARQMIDAAVAAASQAPYPPVSDAAFPVYAEDIRHA